ncbi:hypothetical protein [Micromonospora sp. NPDC047740]|uniref:hypothetical protein n=1 Tax=Micromonospora sp. NPDC047740 TaxID=3364254 RepID=UPI00371C4DCA
MFLILGSTLNFLASFFWEDDRQGITAGALVALSTACWLIGLFGLYERLRPAAPRFVAVALPVAVFGAVGGVAFGVQSVHEGLFDVSHATAVELLDERSAFAAYTLFWTAGPLFPLSLFALGLVLAWTRAAPVAVGLLISLGAIAFPLSRISREVWIAHLADVLLMLPFVYLGVRELMRRRRGAAQQLPATA